MRSSWLSKLDPRDTKAILLVEHTPFVNLDQIIDFVENIGWKSFHFKVLKPSLFSFENSELVKSEVERFRSNPDLVLLVGWGAWQVRMHGAVQSHAARGSAVDRDLGYKIVSFGPLVVAKDAVNFEFAPEHYGRSLRETLLKKNPRSWSLVSAPPGDLTFMQIRVAEGLLARRTNSDRGLQELDCNA